MDLFSLAERRLAYIDKRQQVLAENVANANTPGWRTRDLKPFESVLAGETTVPVRTNAKHLAGKTVGMRSDLVAGEQAPDGNAVSLDQELVKVADNDAAQALVADLYKKYIGLFRAALGR